MLIAVLTMVRHRQRNDGVAIFDLVRMHANTGIGHRRLKPTLGLLDPDNTLTQPPEVPAATGPDGLCHAIESFTAIPYQQRERPARPTLRPAYQGSNRPGSAMSGRFTPCGWRQNTRSARWRTSATTKPAAYRGLRPPHAGVGFGNAGCHLPQGGSYPVSGRVRSYMPPGYPVDHPMVPHGMSVIPNAPAVFGFTASACSGPAPGRRRSSLAATWRSTPTMPAACWPTPSLDTWRSQGSRTGCARSVTTLGHSCSGGRNAPSTARHQAVAPAGGQRRPGGDVRAGAGRLPTFAARRERADGGQ
ncbi:MAG: iron-containing alcohol dehydrogenase [Bryobacterales bacterium]|nr:iron-containing alcohol dehydrogenase [Bryobacterales bacterium]